MLPLVSPGEQGCDAASRSFVAAAFHLDERRGFAIETIVCQGVFGGCPARSICYDMNCVDESFEWTDVRNASPDEVQVLDEKMDLGLLQACPTLALYTLYVIIQQCQ